MIKRIIYLGKTGEVDVDSPTFFSSKLQLVDNTGATVTGKWVEVVAQGSNASGDAPRTVAIDQGPSSDQP